MNGVSFRPTPVRFGNLFEDRPYPAGTATQPPNVPAQPPQKMSVGKRIAASIAALLTVAGAGGGGWYVGQMQNDTLELRNRELTQTNVALTEEKGTLTASNTKLTQENQTLQTKKTTLETSATETTAKLEEAEKKIAALEQQLKAAQDEQQASVDNQPADNNAIPGFDAAAYKPVEKQGPKVPDANYVPRGNTDKKPVGLLHETVGSLDEAVAHFTNPKSGVASHIIIDRNGEVTLMVAPNLAARGAGHSEFNGESEPYDRPDAPKSVNAFAYQIELVSPEDGYSTEAQAKSPKHSGYTDKQLQAAAYYFVKAGIPLEQVTTHKAVALPKGRKADPRSFEQEKFEAYYNAIKAAQPEVTIDLGLKAQNKSN